MSRMRVYLPATLRLLVQLRRRGELSVAQAHAVTPALREWYADADAEQLAHAAYIRAAQDSIRLLSADPHTPRRRVVVSADAPVALGSQPLGSSAVTLPGPVPLSAIVAIHVDGTAAEADVAAAASAVPAADAGDRDARLVVDGAEDHELEWFDVSELDQLVA